MEYHVVPDVAAWAETAGWLRPEIIVSRGLLNHLSGGELTAVLRHEAEHVRRFDPLWSGLIEGIFRALWRPNWMQGILRMLFTLRELSADAVATGNYGRRQDLGGALLKLLSGQHPSTVAAFSPNSDRVTKLTNPGWIPYEQAWRDIRRIFYGASFGLALSLSLLIGSGQAASVTGGSCPASVRERMCVPKTTVVCTFQSGWQCVRFISHESVTSVE